jgi:hypothetical protein
VTMPRAATNISYSSELLHASPIPTRRTGLWLIIALMIVTIGTGWFINERIITRDVFHQLLDARLDTSRVDSQFDLIRQIQVWGYLAMPLILLIRLTAVALTVQLFLLLAREVSFRKVFLATAWAQVAMCAAGIERAFYLALLPSSDISQATLWVMPGSLASLLLYPEDIQRPLYAMLSLVSVFELLWCAILFIVLRRVARVSTLAAVSATVGTWTLLAALQLAITSYFGAA